MRNVTLSEKATKTKFHLLKIYYGITDRINNNKKFIFKIRQCLSIPFKLDVHAVEHCNLNCKGCSHFAPIAAPKFLDPTELGKNLSKLSKFQSSFYALQILGGEPLLHPRLAEIMDVSRRYFDKIRITLMTNGILLLEDDKLPPSFWEACKKNDIVIRVTKYPVNLDYDEIERKVRQKGIKFELFKDRSGVNNWTKYQLHEKDIRKRLNRFKVFKLKYCKSINCLQLVGNKIYPCHLSAYVDHLNVAYNRNFVISKKDYIDINSLKNIRQLKKLLVFSIPFCKYCGSGTPRTDWQKSKMTIDEWVDTRYDKNYK